jgi:hypothetical protein
MTKPKTKLYEAKMTINVTAYFTVSDDQHVHNEACQAVLDEMAYINSFDEIVDIQEVTSYKHELPSRWSWRSAPYTYGAAANNPGELRDYVDFSPENE